MDEESLKDEGFEEGKKTMIINLHSIANMPIEQIAKVAEISEEEVKKILENK